MPEQQDHVFEVLHLLRDVQENFPQVVKPQPEDAFRFSAMVLEGDGVLFVQPFSGKMAPTEGDRQQSHEFIDPLRLGQMGILKAKPAAFEALK